MIEKTNIQLMLGYFCVRPTKKAHLRELSRELGVSMPTVIAAVRALQKEKLVIVERGKALTTVQANAENLAFTRLKRLINLESLYASGLVDFLQKEFKRPTAIVVFGSYSRGDDIEASDIDIAVIGGTKKEVALEKYEAMLQRRISLHHPELDKSSLEFKTNLCNGIVLTGAL